MKFNVYIQRVLVVSLVLSFVLSPGLVFAAPPTLSGLFDVIANALDAFIRFAEIVAVIMIIFGGYMWMIATGDPQRIQTAQGTVTWAVIGLLFLIIFDIILGIVVNNFLGLSI